MDTILHVKSSGPSGRAGLEYTKCLEYWQTNSHQKLFDGSIKVYPKL